MQENKVISSYECMNSCILNHLRKQNILLNGSDIFFSGKGYIVRYRHGSVTQISTNGYEANFEFLRRYGINYNFGQVEPTKTNLLKCLESSNPITIRMSSDFLTYDSIFSQTEGASHFINILMYDEKIRKFLVVDGNVPSLQTGTFYGWVEEDSILGGWQRKCGEILQLLLCPDNSLDNINERVTYDANKNVKCAIEKYLNGKRGKFIGDAKGECAIIEMIKEMSKCCEKPGFRMITREANFRIRVDGFLGGKKFLLEKMQLQNNNIANEYKEIVDDWSRWCMLLLKSGIVNEKKTFLLVCERSKVIINKERNLLETFLDFI